MNINITLLDFEKEYLPFQFPGFWDKGYCYLQVIIKNGKAIFICSQLPNYNGTSVTNAVESIRATIINELIKNNILQINIDTGIFEQFFTNKNKQEENKKKTLEKYISKNSIWIEHYPEGVGIVSTGSYSLVNFSDNGEPTWSYLSKEYINEKFNIELNIPLEKLKQWKI